MCLSHAAPAGAGYEPAPVAVSRKRHWEMLLVACVTIVASLLLSVENGERVHVTGISAIPMPKLCFSREIFGVACPGCGLTRSFVYLAHGDWQGAWAMHRLGWLMFLSLLLQFPYRLQALLSPRGSVLPVAFAKAYGNMLIVALIANWIVGLVWLGEGG